MPPPTASARLSVGKIAASLPGRRRGRRTPGGSRVVCGGSPPPCDARGARRRRPACGVCPSAVGRARCAATGAAWPGRRCWCSVRGGSRDGTRRSGSRTRHEPRPAAHTLSPTPIGSPISDSPYSDSVTVIGPDRRVACVSPVCLLDPLTGDGVRCVPLPTEPRCDMPRTAVHRYRKTKRTWQRAAPTPLARSSSNQISCAHTHASLDSLAQRPGCDTSAMADEEVTTAVAWLCNDGVSIENVMDPLVVSGAVHLRLVPLSRRRCGSALGGIVVRLLPLRRRRCCARARLGVQDRVSRAVSPAAQAALDTSHVVKTHGRLRGAQSTSLFLARSTGSGQAPASCTPRARTAAVRLLQCCYVVYQVSIRVRAPGSRPFPTFA